jgi:hypothetical protein
MNFKRILLVAVTLLFASDLSFAQSGNVDQKSYLTWTAKTVTAIGKQMRQKGKVGSSFALRGLNTQRAINYKLRATLMTPEMIRASARFHQLRNRLTDDQTRALVREAEDSGDLVVMIEIDPNEGSGVVPRNWRVFLQPKGLRPDTDGAISGIKAQHLRNVKALTGVFRRKYDYDVFMVAFPLVDENKKQLISPDIGAIEILVGIENSEGRVSWRMPESIRVKIRSLSADSQKEETK